MCIVRKGDVSTSRREIKGSEFLQIRKVIKYEERWGDQPWGIPLCFIQNKGKIMVTHSFNPSPQEQRQGIAMSLRSA